MSETQNDALMKIQSDCGLAVSAINTWRQPSTSPSPTEAQLIAANSAMQVILAVEGNALLLQQHLTDGLYNQCKINLQEATAQLTQTTAKLTLFLGAGQEIITALTFVAEIGDLVAVV